MSNLFRDMNRDRTDDMIQLLERCSRFHEADIRYTCKMWLDDVLAKKKQRDAEVYRKEIGEEFDDTMGGGGYYMVRKISLNRKEPKLKRNSLR